MRKYPEYKASGIDWIGNVPEHWDLKTLRRITKEHRQGYYIDEPYINEGVKLVRITDLQSDGSIDYSEMPFVKILESHEKLYKIDEGDFLFPRTGTIGSLGFVKIPERAVFASYLIRFRFKKDKILNEFLYFYFMSDVFLNGVFSDLHGGVVQNIHAENIKNQLISHPKELSEQNSIVRFLDYKTGQIDSFIANRQKQIELLKEQKAGIINKAVTKGINPHAKMKDSGIEWIGDVPEHWEIIKLKFIIKTMASGVSVNSTDDPAEPFEFGILKTSCVYSGEFNPNENKKILESEYDRKACQVKGNSIIMSRMNTPELVGANGFVDKDYKNLFLPDRLWQTVFFKKAQIVPKWLSYFFASHRFRTLISSLATGTSASMKNITQEDVLGSSISLPPIEEQNEMLIFFENETSIIDTLISKYQKQIDLMQEYRTSLISQAVTGKIDVREWQPKRKAV